MPCHKGCTNFLLKVRRRVKALKKLQLEATNLEAKFYEEVNTNDRPVKLSFVQLENFRIDPNSKIFKNLLFHELRSQVYALEKKYHAMHNPLYQQRAAITDVRKLQSICD